MKTYYINQIDGISSIDGYKIGPTFGKTSPEYRMYGLFDSAEWVGEGHFCGWYGGEYYKNTRLLAYSIVPSNVPCVFTPELPGGTFVKNVNQQHEKIGIQSKLCEIRFEAKNDEEAMAVFEKKEWVLHPVSK